MSLFLCARTPRNQFDVQGPFLPEIEDELICPIFAVTLQLQIKIPQRST